MGDSSVLIVEDDVKIAEINAKLIERIEGISVSGIATTIGEAKELLPIIKPDLVLLDVYFPDGSGIDLLWHMRSHFRDTDVIMITAAKEVQNVGDAIRGGAFDFILKPIVFNRFEETIRKYLNYKTKLKDVNAMNQEVVDSLFHTVRKRHISSNAEVAATPPKGIDQHTLSLIKNSFYESKEGGMTAEEISKITGVSRTTSRRYLEFLVSLGQLRTELVYGTVGRPERRYFANEN
ncbi:response regulator [Mesobacillus harenae]|uniref:response regulator n=1 Tax=Mesobacillus harenae TaxID=2213203 RepID=UPI00158057EA|nr:response regulator [Mesobacillus harenae]